MIPMSIKVRRKLFLTFAPLAVLVVVLVSACGDAEPTPTPRELGSGVGQRAPDFIAGGEWINSGPLSMEELRGKVVLVDFWTYTCVNCIRTFPFLKEWHAKYADDGLVIVGVHSPEFDFEKLYDNVVASAEEFGLEYAIVQDNDFDTWRAYDNRFWPAKYLIDKEGTVRYTHFGEGGYDETEEQIRQLLEEAGADVSSIALVGFAGPEVDPSARTLNPSEGITREIYGGYLRNNTQQGVYVAHVKYYDGPGRVVDYTDPGDHQNQFIFLQGPWLNGFESLQHARTTEDYEDYIAMKFFATSVNAVIDPQVEEPFDVRVTIDDRPLRGEEAGADVTIAGGQSFFTVDEARLYEVVALPTYGGHELKLSSNSEGFALFAFTFGAYTEGL